MAKKLIEEDLRLNILINGDAGKKAALDAAKTYDELGKKLEKAKEELGKIDAATKKQGYEDQKKKVQALSAAFEGARQRMESLNRQQQVGTMTMGELQRHIRLTSLALRDAIPGTKQWELFNKELRESKERLKELRSQSVQTEGILKRLWTSTAGAVAILQTGWAAIMRLAGALRSAFDTLKDFEQANVNLATILGRSTKDIEMLTSEAERLGRTTRYTASEVTGLQIELAKLGFNQGQIQTMEESVLHFATAVGADLPEAAALAGSTLRMFGLSTKDTEDTLATLALATNKSALSFSFFQNALSTVGPVANTFGFSVKDTTALLGSLANAGFDASSAATATRNIILNLANANGKLAKALGEPVRTFDDLIAGLQSLDEKGIDLAATLELTDKRSVAAFNTFLHGTDAAAALRAELEETDGVLKQIADQRANTLAGAIDKLSSAWEGFILKLKGSTGFLKQAVEYLTEIVTWITPGSRHDADVENTVDTITAGYGTAEGRAYVADQKVKDLQSQMDKLDEDLEKANDRRSRRRIEKEKKRIEKELSVYQDAYARLQSVADALADDSGSGQGTSGNKSGSGSGAGGDGGKGKKSWFLQADEGYLAAKAELTRQYNEGAIKSQEEYEERIYQLEVSSLQARLALNKEKGTERIKIENDIQNKIMAHNAKVLKDQQKAAEEAKKIEEQIQQARIAASDNYNEKAEAQVAVENARFEKEMKQLEKKKGQIKDYDRAVETLQRQHDNNLRKIELDRLSAEMKDLESAHKTALAEIQRQNEYELQLDSTSSARKLEIRRKRDEAVAAENLKFAQQQYQFLQGIVSSGEIAGMALSKEQLAQYKLQLEEVRKQLQDADAALKNQTTSSAFSGTGDASLFGVSQKDWETFFANLADSTLKAKDLQTAITGIGGAAQEGFKIANQAIQLTNAKEKKALDDYKKGQESRKKELEARYKAGLMTESQYNDEVEQMEADMQAKQEEADLRQAERTKKMSIFESIINTALGVTKTLAQWGVPAGIAPAAIMTAMGTAQTAMIYAQSTGYAEGGEIQVQRAQDGRSFRAKVDPTRRGYVDRPTVLVGEDGPEYVISAEALKNPDIRAYADTIEQARRTGRLRSLRMEAVRPAQPVVGRAEGGFTQDGTPSGAIGFSPTVMQDLTRLSETVDRLSAILEDGIEAEVVMTGRKGLVRRFEEYNRMKNRGQL